MLFDLLLRLFLKPQLMVHTSYSWLHKEGLAIIDFDLSLPVVYEFSGKI